MTSVNETTYRDPNADWRHAIDLVTTGRAIELADAMPTYERFAWTAFGALAYALEYSPHDRKPAKGNISTREARAALAAIDSDEPDDKGVLLQLFAPPTLCHMQQGPVWAVNRGREQHPEDKAWGLVVGIERGWFAYDRGGYLRWTAKGRDLHAAGGAASFVESDTGQSAFTF